LIFQAYNHNNKIANHRISSALRKNVSDIDSSCKRGPNDYVLATGESHAVCELVELAFKYGGITMQWQGEGLDEIGVNASDPSLLLVRIDGK
jgi:hypothetical protein